MSHPTVDPLCEPIQRRDYWYSQIFARFSIWRLSVWIWIVPSFPLLSTVQFVRKWSLPIAIFWSPRFLWRRECHPLQTRPFPWHDGDIFHSATSLSKRHRRQRSSFLRHRSIAICSLFRPPFWNQNQRRLLQCNKELQTRNSPKIQLWPIWGLDCWSNYSNG